MSVSSTSAVLLIGAGRVGLNLLRHLRHRGFPVPAVVEPDIERHAAIRSLLPESRVLSSLPAALPQEIDVCIIAVPDRHIAGVAQHLAAGLGDPPSALFLHVSGFLNADALRALTDAGGAAGGMHPVQSFPDAALPPGVLDGIGCGIDGSDTFWERARAFAGELGWQPFRVASDRKALYHAACVFAGNFPVTLLVLAERLLRHAAAEDVATGDGPIRDLVLPMMETVVERLRGIPAEQALTGPAARGEIETVAAHLAALAERDPDAMRSYAELTRVAAEIGGTSGAQIITLLDTWKPDSSNANRNVKGSGEDVTQGSEKTGLF